MASIAVPWYNPVFHAFFDFGCTFFFYVLYKKWCRQKRFKAYIPCSSMNSLARVLFMYIKSQVMNLFMARKNMFISKFNFISMKKQNSLLFLNRLKLLTIIEC